MLTNNLTKQLSSNFKIKTDLAHKLHYFYPTTIMIIIIILGYLIDLSTMQKKLHNAQKQISISQTRLSSQISVQKHLAEIKKEFETLNSEYISYHFKSSANVDFPLFLQDLFGIANKNHIEIISVTPSNINSHEHNQKQNDNDPIQMVTIEINGEYQQITNFCNSFSQLKLATDTPILVIQRNFDNDINNKLTANISLIVYNFHYKIGKQKISIKRDPFYQNESNNNTDFSKWSGEELHLIGVFSQDKQIIGVVKDPEGFTHYLTSGDTISSKHSKINNITANAIITDDPSENIYREN